MHFITNNASALLLLFFVGLGIVGQNPSVTVASLMLLLVQQTPLLKFAPLLEQYGLKLGIMLLTIGVLAPLITGKIQATEIAQLLSSWRTIAAVLIGLLVAWLGGRGVTLMRADPTVVTGLMVGTIFGVAFLKGVPVGPLIAAGLLSLLLW
ncbi:DUF441 domain-containing protein [Neisseriaceae bacterium ESL0693]|nr:DUF441 domain-containing protein [Neisseriaceae bacterium ESL0693]